MKIPVETYQDGVLVESGEVDVPDRPPSLSQALNAIFETLDEDLQADLAPLKAAVKLELDQGRINITRKIIERAQIPAELEPLRAAMLEKFPP